MKRHEWATLKEMAVPVRAGGKIGIASPVRRGDLYADAYAMTDLPLVFENRDGDEAWRRHATLGLSLRKAIGSQFMVSTDSARNFNRLSQLRAWKLKQQNSPRCVMSDNGYSVY